MAAAWPGQVRHLPGRRELLRSMWSPTAAHRRWSADGPARGRLARRGSPPRPWTPTAAMPRRCAPHCRTPCGYSMPSTWCASGSPRSMRSGVGSNARNTGTPRPLRPPALRHPPATAARPRPPLRALLDPTAGRPGRRLHTGRAARPNLRRRPGPRTDLLHPRSVPGRRRRCIGGWPTAPTPTSPNWSGWPARSTPGAPKLWPTSTPAACPTGPPK